MIHRFAALTVAGFGLIFIAANPTEVPPTSTASSSLTSPSNLASTTEEALSLSIDYDAAKKSFQLSFEATDREQYYLLEGRGSLTQGDWQVGYGIKGTGIPMTTPMGADSDKGFYRLSRTGSDDDRLQVDFDGDRVVLLAAREDAHAVVPQLALLVAHVPLVALARLLEAPVVRVVLRVLHVRVGRAADLIVGARRCARSS